ncbi:AI-2E family transporter [Phytohabitans houttuyneae]|uniref:AI-2E family transporter n=1 Tax=Phytohabitans houttuyneae TaxID=1076126 RepID=A0A6V8KUH9_9ACTN|nr:AI-2E family transporter [Phytohabitans houttuyneae]GFJ84245.1 AI-2E family transporter [Phytohabitans houttuyneae]
MASADTRTTARRTLIVIGLVLATALLVILVMRTARVLVWIAVAGFFAVALNPAVDWTQRRLAWRRRWLATLLVFLAIVLLIGGLVALLVVPLVREGAQLYDQLPQLAADVRAGRGPVGRLAERFHVLDYVERHSDQIREHVSGLGTPALAFVTGAATAVAGAVTVFVLAYLMVLEAPRIREGVLGLFAPHVAERIGRVGAACARTITGYITGNLLISFICGTLTYVVLLILGVPFAGLIALFVGIADLIPLVGATLGAVVAILAGFTTSVTAGIVLLIFFVAYQQLENHLLQPLIFSRTVRLNPLTVLIAILLAVELAGILGALLAIPVAGIVQIVARELWSSRRPTGVASTPSSTVDAAPDG